MAECECLSGCIFFHDKMAAMPAMANLMKNKYCLGDASECARHVVFQAKGKGNVPIDLFPNQADRAQQIIRG